MLGLAISYLFRPMTWVGAPTIIAWFSHFIISKEFGPIIVICGTTGAAIGSVVCWFIYQSEFKKAFIIDNRIWLSMLLLVLFAGIVSMIVIGTGLVHFFP